MLELALLRHAKSEPGRPDQRDFERPLNRRGEQAAERMGHHLRERGMAPGRILCSPARRVRETLARLGPGFSDNAEIAFCDDLFLAPPQTLLSQIAGVGAGVRSVLVIAHNPGLEQLALELADRGAGFPGALDRLATGFVSAALAVFELDAESYSDIGHETSRLVHFATPRSLG